jgi:hypothetical protein
MDAPPAARPRIPGPVRAGVASLALAALLASCATLPPVRPAGSWFDRLPEGPVYLYLDAASERFFLKDAVSGAPKNFSGAVERTSAVYAVLDPGSPGSAGSGLSLVATGNFPVGAMRFAMATNGSWKQKRDGPVSWYENSHRVQIAFPENGAVFVTDDASRGTVAAMIRGGTGRREPFPPQFLEACGRNPLCLYVADPGSFLRTVLPVRVDLPILDATAAFEDSGSAFTGDVVLAMANERDARVYANVVRLAVTLSGRTGGLGPLDLSNAGTEASGTSILVHGVSLSKEGLKAVLSKTIAKNVTGNRDKGDSK